MRIAIVGCGAMGSVYAGLLADAGNEVWAVDAWDEHVQAIARDGLRVEGASGDRRVRLAATTDAGAVPPCELVVIATKVRDVTAAAGAAARIVAPGGVVVSIQNGLGGPDRARAVVGDDRVLVGVAGGFGAVLRGPGHVHHGGMELIRLGEPDGPATARVHDVAAVWVAAGFRVRAYDDVQQLVWEKLVCNTCFSGTATLTGHTIGGIMGDPSAWPVALACAVETARTARARGVTLAFDDVEAYVRAFGEKIAGERPSMLLDLLAGRPGEIDAINGAIPAAAAAAGLDAPTNALVAQLVRARERVVLAERRA